MESFRTYLESNSFADMFANLGNSKIINSKVKVIPFILQLWRGFNGDLNNFILDDKHYLLKPDRSDQNMLWFTHPYINYYNPIEYAKNHGQWFLSHKLPCKKHVQINHWDDGSESEYLPDYWKDLAEPTRNGQYHAGIELPKGWIFSYKTEKFVGYKGKLKVLKSDVVQSDSVE